ncbi:MAG TPA: right-handed parallel beta-helix repeat-containing protein, partial [Candidatus Bathyarchaeia archaeon]|nr:right-handed parallel beta-helix repeat-containing protein [Candidatus Bathyarchaeia archaeon]
MSKALLASLGAFAVALAAAGGPGRASLPGRSATLDNPAVTYYVATDGDDAHDGRSPRRVRGSHGPFRTLRRAAAAVKAGDTVAVRGGTYEEASTWAVDGAEGRPITIEAYENEAVLIRGRSHKLPPGTYGSLLHVSGRWVTVRGLDVGYSSWYGVTVSGEHCRVEGVFAHHNWSSGIVFSGSYGLVVDCRAFNNSLINERYRPHNGTWGFGISACRHPTSTTIRRSVAWDNWGEGISTFESTGTTIEDCISYNNQQNFYISDTTFCAFRRNLSYFTPGNMIQPYETQTGILMGDEKRNPPSANNTVINNVVWGGKRNIAIGRGVFENGLVANNTFVEAAGAPGAEPANVWINAGRYRNARFVNNLVVQHGRPVIALVDARGVVF